MLQTIDKGLVEALMNQTIKPMQLHLTAISVPKGQEQYILNCFKLALTRYPHPLQLELARHLKIKLDLLLASVCKENPNISFEYEAAQIKRSKTRQNLGEFFAQPSPPKIIAPTPVRAQKFHTWPVTSKQTQLKPALKASSHTSRKP